MLTKQQRGCQDDQGQQRPGPSSLLQYCRPYSARTGTIACDVPRQQQRTAPSSQRSPKAGARPPAPEQTIAAGTPPPGHTPPLASPAQCPAGESTGSAQRVLPQERKRVV